MPPRKQKFASLFADFVGTLVFDVPKVFFDSHPIYRAMRRARMHDRKIKRGLYNLSRRGLIRQRGDGYEITGKGRKWAINAKIKYFKLTNKTWDKKWRIIIFDIPSVMERQRKSFRYRLKQIGAYMIQESVFVFPYPCEVEVGEWCQELGLADHVDMITTDHIGSKEILAKKHFEL